LHELAAVLQEPWPLQAFFAVLQALWPLHSLPAVLQSLVPLHEFTPTQATEALPLAALAPVAAQPDRINAAAPTANNAPLLIFDDAFDEICVVIFYS
jgi:hypothetical protein